ncbi:hypothetical protein [Macellibacteroides fermentans]|uniref:hypothetical protein n=1 Tax=Macellibacteroides fermentans TaxID=879969 RepID=UPI00406C6683
MKLNMQLFGNVYFAPHIKFNQVAWKDPEELFIQFNNRIIGFFIDPAENMTGIWDSFASTLIKVCAIDAIIRLRKEMMREKLQKDADENGKVRKNRRNYRDVCEVGIDDWKSYLQSFNNISENKIKMFYEQVRCGLVHEGRLKKASMIDAFGHTNKSAIEYESVLVITPDLLTNEVKTLLTTLKNDITNEDVGIQFIQAMGRLFSEDRKYFDAENEGQFGKIEESSILVI